MDITAYIKALTSTGHPGEEVFHDRIDGKALVKKSKGKVIGNQVIFYRQRTGDIFDG